MSNLYDFPEEPERREIWRTSVPSKSKAGQFWTVIAFSDGSYDCDCPGRRKQFMCHHIRGAILLLEGKEIQKQKDRLSGRQRELVDFIHEYNGENNSLITYFNPTVQEWMGVALKRVLKGIIDNPGITRRDLPKATYVHYNTIGKAVIDLLEMNLIVENGVDDSSGNPRAKLFLNDAVMLPGEPPST